MKWLIIVPVVLLAIGPMRKRLLSAWQIVVPLAIGGVIGFVAVTRLMYGAPGWLLIVGPVFGALLFAPAIVELFHMMKR